MVDVKLELETLSSHQLYVIVSEAAGILKDRSNIKEMLRETGKVVSPLGTERKEKKEASSKRVKKGEKSNKDFSKLDEFLKENYGTMTIREVVAAAWKEKGIKTDKQQIYYRIKVIGLRKKWKMNPAAVNRDPLDAIPKETEMEV